MLLERSRVANPSGWLGEAAHPQHRPNATWSSTKPQGARRTAGQWQGPLCHAEGAGDTEGKHKLIAMFSPFRSTTPGFLWSVHYFGLLNKLKREGRGSLRKVCIVYPQLLTEGTQIQPPQATPGGDHQLAQQLAQRSPLCQHA